MAEQRAASRRRYTRRIWPTWAIYVTVLLASKWLLETAELTKVLGYLVAVAPALPLVAVIFFVGQLLYGKEDEFQRALWIEALLWGTAITLVATTVWGFLEIAGAPPIRLYWVFPFFTGAALCCVPFLARKYE
jgi:quinol-cytochrome oxidoreductase complex cytochrome b subunit